MTLTPAAMVSVIAGSPAAVAGILIMTFGRPTAWYRRRASATVRGVSLARKGLTSRLT